jgi:hypothetical protein
MPVYALLVLQTASAAAADPNVLLHPVPPRSCEASGSDIVVCARDREEYRLHGAGPQIEPTGPAKAEWRLFGDTKMGLHAEQRSSGGFTAPAAMVTVTVPF